MPEAGFRFDHWELDGEIVSREPSYTLLMDDDHTLTPVFTSTAAPPYELYAIIGVLVVAMIAGWVYAFTRRRRSA